MPNILDWDMQEAVEVDHIERMIADMLEEQEFVEESEEVQ
jgi:hypothetical protein